MNSLVLKPSQVKVIPTVEKPDNLGSQEGHLLRSDTKERSRVRVPHKRGCCWVVHCNGPDRSQAPSETLLPENAFPKAAAEGPNYKPSPLSDAVKNPQKADNRGQGEAKQRLDHACKHAFNMYGRPKSATLWGCGAEQASP